MDQIEHQQPVGEEVSPVRGAHVQSREKDSHLDCGVGMFLKDERLKKGLDYNQISEVTRIRPHFLKAIENEEWDRLPSTIFVKSFIRSYARALGLEGGEIVARYQNEDPAITGPPKPIQEPRRSRIRFAFVLIFLLLIVAVIYYYWSDSLTPEDSSDHSRSAGAVSDQVANSEPAEDVDVPAEPSSSHGQEELGADLALNARGRGFVGDEGYESQSTASETAVEIIKRESLRKTSEDQEKRPDNENAPTPESETGLEVTTPELVLTASVLEKTWIRIFVDGQNPKEYIFRPGSSPEWRASEGFELLVGNAGGIKLELNGQEIKKLGNPGQVVHLYLPEGYTRTALEN